jgi:hypothetical protein
MVVLDQTWLGGNTISDLLIASAMLYHVNSSFVFLYKEPFEADRPTPIQQLIGMKARGNFSTHALASIVRLTVETNVVTSELRVFDVTMSRRRLTRVQPLSVS